MRRLLNKKQTAELTGYHEEHLMRLARQRKFPAPIKLGDTAASAVRWVEDEVDEWIEARMAARVPVGITPQEAREPAAL